MPSDARRERLGLQRKSHVEHDLIEPVTTGTGPELPPDSTETPSFVIFEERVRHNLRKTAEACGGMDRLMPHLKTHRASWIVELLLSQGVRAFKAATVAEVEMAVDAGAPHVTWAYPTASRANIARFVSFARKHRSATFVGVVDSFAALETWETLLTGADSNISLRVDLDPGLGRTGMPMSEVALPLARAVHACRHLAGWHVYDGHVKGTYAERRAQVRELCAKVRRLGDVLRSEGIETDVVAGGSYTFDIWPADVAAYVSPGSWTYSSAQHDVELAHLGWQPAAFVLASVVSARSGTLTLDAGCKAITPDKPLVDRFRWNGRVLLMNEEHTVVEGDNLSVGDRVLLIPQHACTTAYLYDSALVKTIDGRWERRPQMGNAR
jgi:D-serine deaminase-like pyridoxal phosphate-dependent protein